MLSLFGAKIRAPQSPLFCNPIAATLFWSVSAFLLLRHLPPSLSQYCSGCFLPIEVHYAAWKMHRKDHFSLARDPQWLPTAYKINAKLLGSEPPTQGLNPPLVFLLSYYSSAYDSARLLRFLFFEVLPENKLYLLIFMTLDKLCPLSWMSFSPSISAGGIHLSFISCFP